MSNVNTRAVLDAELSMNPRATGLTTLQRAQVIDQATPHVKVAGGNHAEALDRAITHVIFGIPMPPRP
jgi:hypothetical protein